MKTKETKFEKIKFKIKYLIVYAACILLTFPQISHAANPGFVTSILNLVKDACTWVVIVDASVAGLVCAGHGIKWKMVSKDKRPAEFEAIKGTAGMAVLVAIAPAIVAVVLGYFTSV